MKDFYKPREPRDWTNHPEGIPEEGKNKGENRGSHQKYPEEDVTSPEEIMRILAGMNIDDVEDPVEDITSPEEIKKILEGMDIGDIGNSTPPDIIDGEKVNPEQNPSQGSSFEDMLKEIMGDLEPEVQVAIKGAQPAGEGFKGSDVLPLADEIVDPEITDRVLSDQRSFDQSIKDMIREIME